MQPTRDWKLLGIKKSERSDFDVVGENLNFLPGHMDRTFFWTLDRKALSSPRYDASEAVIAPDALEWMGKVNLSTPVGSV